jgi:transposase
VPDRACLGGIVFVLRSGIPWERLPQELDCGSGTKCWRRLPDWQEAGIWQLMHFVMLDWLSRFGRIDWSRAILDSSSVRAVFGGAETGPNPTDRAKLGGKRHLICDGGGVPLVIQLTGAKRNDTQQALALVDAIPKLQGGHGRPRCRPDCIIGDRGYDAEISFGACGFDTKSVPTSRGLPFAWDTFRSVGVRWRGLPQLQTCGLFLFGISKLCMTPGSRCDCVWPSSHSRVPVSCRN